MDKTICDKCFGPIVEENDKFVCAVCGATYGKCTPVVEEEVPSFYKNVTLEKFRSITNRLENCVSYGNSSVFLTTKGPMSIEEPSPFYGVEQVYDEARVGITRDGELQARNIETDESWLRICKAFGDTPPIKKHCCSHMDTSLYNGEQEYFLGIDTLGKVVIYNPFSVFNLRKNNPEEVERCVKVVKTLKNLPPIRDLKKIGRNWIAITKSGSIVSLEISSYKSDSIQEISKWERIESIVKLCRKIGSFSSEHWIGLKKEGTIVAINDSNSSRNFKHYEGDSVANFYEIKNSNVVQIRELPIGIGILYLNGDLVIIHEDIRKKEQTLVKNVVAIVEKGYVTIDGSLWRGSYDKEAFQKVDDVKMFDNIETLHEEWDSYLSSSLKKKQEAQKAYEKCKNEFTGLLTEVKQLKEQKESLGLFQLKQKKELEHTLQGLDEKEQVLLNELEVLTKELKYGTSTLEKLVVGGKIVEKRKPNPNLSSYRSSSTLICTEADLAAYRNAQWGTPPKDKSVVGSAVVGGLVAGPAGAVVGAIYAADKNRKNEKNK